MSQLSGATQHAVAQLLNTEATHAVIEGLYLRFEVPPLDPDSTPNKLRKSQNLVRTLNDRGNGTALRELITYVGSPSSGLSPAFKRGSAESVDLYTNYDRDTGLAPTKAPSTRKAQPEPQFKRPGTSAPETTTSTGTPGTKRYVFVVRGRDDAAFGALVALLRALDLRVVTWDDATRGADGGSPHTLEIVRAGIAMSDAVVVLMTPDDLGNVKPQYLQDRDNPREATPSGQARQNVVFEAGWAMALNQKGVVLVRVGDVRPLSDIDGLNYVWLTGDLSSRRALITRLRNCDLDLDDSTDEWRTAGTFEADQPSQ